MAKTEEACLINWRRELLEPLRGSIFEIGAGTGANLNYYPPAIEKLILSEPDRHMREKLLKKLKSFNFDKNIQVVGYSAETIDIEDNSLDFVVSTLVCCSVNNIDSSLKEIYRVLKKGGAFIFLEHVGAKEGSRRRRWQNRINPLWKNIAGNCHLNRDTERAIECAGFVIKTIQRESMRKAIPLVRPTIRGVAVKK